MRTSETPAAEDRNTWPAGDGEMALRIREYDWEVTPLGAVGTWSPMLRSTVEMVLRHGFPMIVLWGPEPIRIYNDPYRRVLGDRRPQELGRPASDCRSEPFGIDETAIERARNGETVTLDDASFPVLRGGRMDDARFTATLSPLVEDGVVAGVLVTAFETTRQVLGDAERGLAERALRESEERFRSFAENLTDVLWIVNADTRQLEYLSPSFAAMWGETRERVMADLGRWLELVHPEDRMRASLAFPRTLEGETVMQSYRIIRPYDGAERWIQDTGFPIRDGSGRITRVGGIAQDLTERTQIEMEVRAKRRELRNLVENIPQLVWRAVDEGRWTWASPQWTKFTGQREQDTHGWGWLEPIHSDDQDSARRLRGRVPLAGQGRQLPLVPDARRAHPLRRWQPRGMVRHFDGCERPPQPSAA